MATISLFNTESALIIAFRKYKFHLLLAAALAQWVKAFAPQAEACVRIPAATDPSRKKQLVTVPLLNAQHQVRVSRVLGDDQYKRMSRVTVGVAR